MADYSRPQGFRFKFDGANTRSQPDALPPDKYVGAVNVRCTSDNSIRTRPGYVPQFNTGLGFPVTDIAAYAAIETDDLPRFLARDTHNNIVLDNGVTASVMAGPAGGGVSMLPFRPSASPQTWMYIAGIGDYQKISAPSGGSVIPAKVGIAEVTNAVDAGVQAPQWTNLSSNAAGWANSGTAGAPADANVLSDTVGTAIYPDPVITTRYTVPTTDAALYLKGMLLVFAKSGGGNFVLPVQDVLPSAVTVAAVTIKAIRYDAGSTGHCIIVPNQFPQQTINLRRACLLTLNSGGGNAETVLVLDAIFGNQEKVAFECVTVNTHIVGEPIVGVDAIIVDGVESSIIGQAVTSPDISSTIATGVGNLDQSLSTKPFQKLFTNSGANTLIPQADDYIHLFLQLTDPTLVTTLEIIFNVGPTVDYTTSILQYTVNGSDLVNQNPNNLIEIQFPISALTAAGVTVPDISPCNGVRLQVTVTGSVSFFWGMFWVGGGGAPDVGDNGAQYQYRIKPRSTLTGSTGNPSPVMRYGVSPRRQTVAIPLPAQYEADLDVFDVYRYGGSVTSYRYIGTGSPTTTFIDQYFDDTAIAGQLLVTDDFEPWPSIDIPFSVYSGGGNLVQVIGTEIVVTSIAAWPATVLNWLPGTLITIGGLQTFTLRQRPTQLTSTTYLFNVEENGGYDAVAASFIVNEPVVARQFAPYMWGPDAYGVVYAVGEQLRPGCVYFSKPYSPDTTNQNVVELCPPSEPLIGGDVLNGVALVASTDRWWALYPNFTTAGAYSPLSISVGRGLAAPFGICSDGAQIYFWAKDCIASMAGAGFKSLTDADLYNLFPHDGVVGRNFTRSGFTYYAPDYSRASSFRLAVANKYLYANYQDSAGVARTLVCDLRTGAWAQDIYHDSMCVTLAVQQQQGTLLTGTPSLYPIVLFADQNGFVWKQQDYHNDNLSPIPGRVGTFEWDGGDQRAGMQWGDQYLDSLAPAGLSVQPVSLGAAVAVPTPIPALGTRQFSPISLGGEVLEKFLGMILSWTDDFVTQTNPTTLFLWQSSLVPKPETIIDRVGDWENGGGAKYYRGFVLEADTFGNAKSFGIRNNDDNTLKPFTINFNGQDDQPFYFTPFVGHLVRYEPGADGVPMRYFGIKWIFDPWPELTNLSSPWMNLGTNAAKYLRAAVIPMDTNGLPVQLQLISSDGGVITLGPFTTTAAEKTQVAVPFVVPLIGHEYQIRPLGQVSIWYEEIKWDVDVYPELITEATPWMNLGTPGAKYMRAVVLVIATEGPPVNIQMLSSDGGSVTLGPFTSPAGVKKPSPWAFSVPLIGHEFQLIPSTPCRIWFEESKWEFEQYPELITEATPWMSLGPVGTKYMRGVVLVIATEGGTASLTMVSSDGGSTNLGPFNTPSGVKTPTPWAFAIPLIGHEFQLIPQQPVRIWFEETRWDFDLWPELINEATGWLKVAPGSGASFLQGAIIPIETGGAVPAINLLTDTGAVIPLVATVTPIANIKTPVPYSLATPVVVHEVQLLPTSPCRIWVPEIQWIAEPTPELATTWQTQASALGSPADVGTNGYKHIPRIDAAYSSTAPVTLTITAFDGISPAPITLPPTGGVYQKILVDLTPNKGMLYTFKASSPQTFQIFANDFGVWVGDWNRQGPYRIYRNLGGQFGDSARI